MNVLTYGYATVSTLTLVWFIIFPFLFSEDELRCKRHPSYWIPNDEFAGSLAFIKTILLIAPTVILWLTFFYFRLPMNFNATSIRLNRESGTVTSSLLKSQGMLPSVMMDVSYNTNNMQNTSALTHNNIRKSAFTANMCGGTQSFAKD